MKVKRTGKAKSPSRRTKSRVLRPTKKTIPPLQVAKAKKAATVRKKKAKPQLDTPLVHAAPTPETPEISDGLTPYAALHDEYALANAWEILGDEEYILDDEIWNTLYSRIKLQLLKASYSFRLEEDGFSLSPYAVTPMPAFRADHEPGYLSAGSFTLLRPELPGVVFDLKISANEQGLILDWLIRRKDAAQSLGHIALYSDGELVEAVNLLQSRCQLELTRDDTGDVSFYFLDADTGKQTKILELNI